MLIILRDDLIDMIDFEEAVHRIRRECLPLPIFYALQNPKIMLQINSILSKETITMKDAKAILTVVNKARGINRTEEFMQELAENAYSLLDGVKLNGVRLKLFIRAMILPEWRRFLKPTMP